MDERLELTRAGISFPMRQPSHGKGIWKGARSNPSSPSRWAERDQGKTASVNMGSASSPPLSLPPLDTEPLRTSPLSRHSLLRALRGLDTNKRKTKLRPTAGGQARERSTLDLEGEGKASQLGRTRSHFVPFSGVTSGRGRDCVLPSCPRPVPGKSY